MKPIARKQNLSHGLIDPETGARVVYADAAGGLKKIRCIKGGCSGFAVKGVRTDGKAIYTCQVCGAGFLHTPF